MKVLVGCEFSGVVRDAFIKQGHVALSCDLLPSESNLGPHFQGDVREVLDWGWDLAIFHPPCTYLTNAGVRHLHENITSRNGKRAAVYGEARMEAMREAAKFFNLLKDAPIERICVENPIPHKYAREIIGYYTQIIQPWMFGHTESKATCLWLKNLPMLIPTHNVKAEMMKLPKNERNKVHWQFPGPDRWKRRSMTYTGIGQAMSEQWSY